MMHRNIRPSEALVMALFVLLAFSVYYLFYLGGTFHQGRSTGIGTQINAAKVVSIALLCSVAAWRAPSRPLNRLDWLFAIAALLMGASFALYGLQHGFNDRMFFNFLLFAPCFVLLVRRDRMPHLVHFSLQVLCVVIAAQVVLDIMLRFAGLTLWLGGLFVGGMGNPSSFGMTCLICAAYLLLTDTPFRPWQRHTMIALHLCGIIWSAALLPVLLCGLLAIMYVARERRRWREACLVSAGHLALIALWVVIAGVPRLLQYKFFSVVGLTGIDVSDHLLIAPPVAQATVPSLGQNLSLSVTGRLETMQLWGDFLHLGLGDVLLGHYDQLAYFPVDGQYLGILLSFGAIAFAIFVACNLAMLGQAISTLRDSPRPQWFPTFVILAFAVVFLNNRILDYYPMTYLYIAALALISASWRTDAYVRRHASLAEDGAIA